MHGEIQRIDQLNKARLGGFWAYLRENLKQGVAFDALTLIFGGALDGLAEALVEVLSVLYEIIRPKKRTSQPTKNSSD